MIYLMLNSAAVTVSFSWLFYYAEWNLIVLLAYPGIANLIELIM
jgi:hypothetical protein